MAFSTPYNPPEQAPPPVDRRPRQRRIAKRLAVFIGAPLVAFLALVLLIAVFATPTPAPIVVADQPIPTVVPAPAAAPPVVPDRALTPPRLAANTFGDGTYEVGQGPGLIAPGRYHYDGSAAMAYWARLADTSGDQGAILANGISRGPATITVKSTDGAVKFSGDAVWIKVA